ncbi:hypothetical protein ACEWY4_025590 [Coilia grayii]|uniref:DUF6729 domain-containing protein n=1 Tax=Coilia grayii TaxID=363190 RepID=A0ABD1IUI6_9TELE
MPDTVWMARLRKFASTGTWPVDEGNKPAPRQKKWYELYQKPVSRASQLLPPPSTPQLPCLWAEGLPPEDHKWVGKVLLRTGAKGKTKLQDNLKLWYTPPPPSHLYHQAPSPDNFFAHHLFVWMPYKLWKVKVVCLNPPCGGNQLTGGGLHKRARGVLDVDRTYNMVTETLICRKCNASHASWSQAVLQQLDLAHRSEFRITKKLAGTAKGTGYWLTSMGNEHGEILMSVMTAEEGSGLDRMADGIMKRYEQAGVDPPVVLYVDCGCCAVTKEKTKLMTRFSKWPNLIVRLDIWHFMRRLALGCTTDAHQLYPLFMSRLSGCIFERDAADLALLREAKAQKLQAQGMSFADVDKYLTRKELTLHCRRRTRGEATTVALVSELLDGLMGTRGHDSLGVPLFDKERMEYIWQHQRKHVKCIQDPPGVALYTKTGELTKGGVRLPVYRCARGSTSLESFHLHLNRFIPGELIGVQYLFQQTGQGLQDMNPDSETTSQLVEDHDELEVAHVEEDEGFFDLSTDPTVLDMEVQQAPSSPDHDTFMQTFGFTTLLPGTASTPLPSTLDPGTTSTLDPGTTSTLDPGTTSTLDPGTSSTLDPGTSSTRDAGTFTQPSSSSSSDTEPEETELKPS